MSYTLVHLYKKLSPESEKGLSVLQGEITAMVVNPNTLYCYWEINQEISPEGILTIYNVTENVSWQMPVETQIGSLYIPIRQRRENDACDFQVAIGIKIGADMTTIALSNIISIPSAAPSNRFDQEWWSPEDVPMLVLHKNRMKVLTNGKRIPSADSPLPSSVCSSSRAY